MAARRRVTNLQVFGSVAPGKDKPGGDLDLLVDPLPGLTLLELCGLHAELQELPGVRVDLATVRQLRPSMKEAILQYAVPV